MSSATESGKNYAIAVCLGLAVVFCAGGAHAQKIAGGGPERSLARYPIDEQEIARMNKDNPHALGLMQQGERVALAGNLSGALLLFDEAAEEYPYSGLLTRRRCEALTALGRRSEAVKLCLEAMGYGPVPLTVRATVRAFLAGPEEWPSANDLAKALMTAGSERRRSSQDLWGYAALCDVADRIGDEVMLEYCSGELLRIAPKDPTTRRVLAELRPAWWVGAAWIGIALAALATAAHALWHFGRRVRSRTGATAIAGLVLLAATLRAVPAQADNAPAQAPSAQPSGAKPLDDMAPWTIDDKYPEGNIPGEGLRNRNPIQFGYWLQDLGARALKSSQLGDHEASIRYFRALAKAVPDRAIAFSKLCNEYDAVGKLNEAITACGAALLLPGVLLNDYFHYLHLVLSKPGKVSDQDLATLLAVVDQVRKDPNGGDEEADAMDCEIGVKMKDAARLQECTTALDVLAPKSSRTLTYKWSFAMLQHRYDDAEEFIKLAKAAKVKPEGLAQMEKETARERSKGRIARVLAALALVLAAGGLMAFARRRRSLLAHPAQTPQAS